MRGLLFTGSGCQRLELRRRVWMLKQTVMRGGCRIILHARQGQMCHFPSHLLSGRLWRGRPWRLAVCRRVRGRSVLSSACGSPAPRRPAAAALAHRQASLPLPPPSLLSHSLLSYLLSLSLSKQQAATNAEAAHGRRLTFAAASPCP
jgi:hypothetical protein